jgi:hypothetical protein
MARPAWHANAGVCDKLAAGVVAVVGSQVLGRYKPPGALRPAAPGCARLRRGKVTCLVAGCGEIMASRK